MMFMPFRRPMRVNFWRLDKLMQHYDMDFLTLYVDCQSLRAFLFPRFDCDPNDIDDIIEIKLPNEFQHLKDPLNEYVVLKTIAIVENGFRNLIIFLIDHIGIDYSSLPNISKTLEIQIDDVDRLSDKKLTKGLLITDSLTLSKPYLINSIFSKLLKLDFHDSLKKLCDLIDLERFQNELDWENVFMNLQMLETSLDTKYDIALEFETIFQKRNEIAHNAESPSLEKFDLDLWVSNCSLYIQYGTAFVLFYVIFCTKFDDYTSLSKLDYFRRDKDDSSSVTLEEIKEVFELLFGVSTEILIDHIKEQQQKYRNSN